MNFGFVKKLFSKTNIIIEFLLSIVLSSSIVDFIYNKTYYDNIKILDIILIAICSTAVIGIIIYNIKKHKKRLEIFFLIFMIPIGMMYHIFLMPNYAPDELEHIKKAYDISCGHIITNIDENGDSKFDVPIILTTGFNTPNDSYKDMEEAFNSETNYSATVKTTTSAQGYSPFQYIFSSIGLFIGRMLNLNIVFAIYLARLLNFIFFLVCGYYAIKLIPFGKLVVLTFLFNSMLIHQAVSVSADSIINSVAVLFIAFNLYILHHRSELDLKNKALYLLLAIIIALSKNIYFPIVAIGLILLKKGTLKSKNDKIFIIVTMLIGVASAVLWYFFGTRYTDVYVSEMNFGYNPSEQIQFILSSPFGFIGILFRTIWNSIIYWLHTFLGYNMGWLNISPFTHIHLIIYGILLVLSPFLENNEKDLKWLSRLWLILIFLGVTLLMLVGFYIQATPVGAPEVESIQGRYFIPFALLPLLCLVFKNINIKIKNIELIYCLTFCAINAVQIYTIANFLLR